MATKEYFIEGFNCAKCGSGIEDNLICSRCGTEYSKIAINPTGQIKRSWPKEQVLNTAVLLIVDILFAVGPYIPTVIDSRQLFLLIVSGLMLSIGSGWFQKFPVIRKARRTGGPKLKIRKITECRNCGAVVTPNQRICNYCGTHQFFVFRYAWEYVTHSKTLRKVALYPGMMVLSFGVFLYIYANHQTLSETRLVKLSPIWIFGFLFGYFGYTAEIFLTLFHHKQASSVWEAFYRWAKDGNPFSVFYLPVPILPFRNPLLFACWGSFVWVFVIHYFFLEIFPSL